jgi:hypothetical protein
MTLTLTHFQALLLFALLVSLAFAFLSKRTLRDRLRYTLWSLLVFLAAAIGIGWLMFFFQR